MQTPENTEIWTEALQEAYASAPIEEIIYNTVEFRHSVDSENTIIRVVSDLGQQHDVLGDVHWGHYFTLEQDAPENGDESVFFQACAFALKLPDQQEGSLPTINIQIDNVTPDILRYLDSTAGSDNTVPIEVTYREYLLSEPNEPSFILNNLILRDATANNNTVTAVATFGDLVNTSFPKLVYRPHEFPGL